MQCGNGVIRPKRFRSNIIQNRIYGQDLTHVAKQMRMTGSVIVQEMGGKRLWRTRIEIGQSSLAHFVDHEALR